MYKADFAAHSFVNRKATRIFSIDSMYYCASEKKRRNGVERERWVTNEKSDDDDSDGDADE